MYYEQERPVSFSRLVLMAGITMLAALIVFSGVAVGVTQGLMAVNVPQQLAALAGIVLGGAAGVWVWKIVDKQFSRNA
jgi:hypothetical protein